MGHGMFFNSPPKPSALAKASWESLSSLYLLELPFSGGGDSRAASGLLDNLCFRIGGAGGFDFAIADTCNFLRGKRDSVKAYDLAFISSLSYAATDPVFYFGKSVITALAQRVVRSGARYKAADDQAVQASSEIAKAIIAASPRGGPQGAIASDLIAQMKSIAESVEASYRSHNKPSKAPREVKEVLADLNGLIGLSGVKREVNSLVNVAQSFGLRKSRGLPNPPISFHLVFSGNPGTGKTTVARLISELYFGIGLLSKGHLVEVDRSGLVAGYIGQTALKVSGVVQGALGGVLFIDEAYSLAKSSGNDYGQEAIEVLLKEMEDNREDLVVIVAGYRAEMERFVASNPGLESRFSRSIIFDDYDPKEMVAIVQQLTAESRLDVSDQAMLKIECYVESLQTNRGKAFANGRDARRLFEEMFTNQANRLSTMSNPSDTQLCAIEAPDVPVWA